MNLQISGSFLQTLRRTAREAIIFTLLGPIVVTLGYLAVQAYNAPAAAPYTKPKMCPNGLSVATQPQQPSSNVLNRVTSKQWTVISYTSIYRRCHFEGQMACIRAIEDDEVAALHKGDEVKVLSKQIRASNGSNIYEVKFQQWTGWVDASDLLPPGFTLVYDPSDIPVTNTTWIAQQETIPCLVGAQVGDQFQTDDPMFDGLHVIRFKQDMYIQGYDGAWIRFPNGEEIPVNRIERVVNHISLSDYVHPKDGLLAGVVFGWAFGFAVWLAYRILRFAIKG